MRLVSDMAKALAIREKMYENWSGLHDTETGNFGVETFMTCGCEQQAEALDHVAVDGRADLRETERHLRLPDRLPRVRQVRLVQCSG